MAGELDFLFFHQTRKAEHTPMIEVRNRKLGGQPEKASLSFVMWKSLLVLLLLATAAQAQENSSAYEALRVVGTQLNREMVSRVISVTGVDGDPQPRSWKVLVEDRRANGGVREILVEDNRIASQRIPNRSVVGSTEGNTINTARLNLDVLLFFASSSRRRRSCICMAGLAPVTQQ